MVFSIRLAGSFLCYIDNGGLGWGEEPGGGRGRLPPDSAPETDRVRIDTAVWLLFSFVLEK